MVNRSALTLKLLTSRLHGSIVASPTFGLPEAVGGPRNWDYRYTWIRDASFTLYGLIRLGYTEEAAAFMRWVEARCEELEPDGALQIMYGIDGRHELTEETLPHLDGYLGSKPVRIGNAAYGNLQLDIYGELMDAIYLYDKYGQPIGHDLWRNVTRFIDWLCANWHQPDEGIFQHATAVLVFRSASGDRAGAQIANLVFYNPVFTPEVEVSGERCRLAADYTMPWAMLLSRTRPLFKTRWTALVNPGETSRPRRLCQCVCAGK